MSERDDGGSAFPVSNPAYDGNWDDRLRLGGMSLRDYFAANASEEDILEHIFKGHKEEYARDNGDGTKSFATREAMWTREEAKYRYADAMVKARDK